MNINFKKWLSTFLIFMVVMAQSLIPTIAKAQELNTAGLVDSFQIGKTNLSTTERTKVTVNFSEKDGLGLKPGDTLTLTLPPELKGLDREFPLDDYGTCKVTAGTVVCTFNDKVSTYENIQGYLNFFVEATNVGTDQKKEIETNFGTTVDKQSVTITGPSSGGGTDPGKQPFFYKTGDMNSGKDNEVRWFLNINLNKEELSRDIVVTDNLQEGQTLNKDSFYISVDNYLGNRYLTLQEFEKQGYGTITFTGDRSFKVVLNKDKARLAAFSIGYTSTITEAGKKQEFFKNDYTIEYQVWNKEPVNESGSYSVENMTAGGGATGNKVPKGKLKIVKHIEGNKEKVIPNVSFKLYKESGEQVGGEYKTNEKGIVETPQLSSGKYYVQEVSAPDYIDFDPQKKVEFEIKSDDENGVELDIPNKVKTTSVSGTKMWNDNNNKFGKRPESITVQLLQNGKEFKTEEVKADKEGNWNFSFKDLPKYDEQGNAYTYTVSEVKVKDYETKVEGTTITNTYKNTETTEVSGKKVWEDYNNKFGKRPESITVQLLQNGKEFKTEEVKADKEGNWNFSFKDLPKYDGQGNAYTYTVSEVKVKDYETKVEGTTITNTYKNTEATEISGKKVWEDYNNKFGKRPESITVQLLQNGKEFKTEEVKADKEGNWNFSFKDLPKYDGQGNAYTYTVSEVKVKDYETKVEGTTITNTYKNTEATEISGKKVWEDYNNKFGKRPESITVQLLQNGKEFKTEEVKADKEGNWNFSFKDLPKYDGQGNAYTYTVSEVKVKDYETKVEGTTITNTYKNTEATEISGKKVWEDYNNKFGKRPESITVQLLQNGKEFKTEEVKADKEGNWNFSFKDLPKYDEQGNAYTYTVSEVKVKDYETKVEGTTITNTYKNTETTEVSGKKVWEDYNNKFNTRPESITVQLLQNGTEFNKQEVKADKEGNWNFSFKDLPKYDEQGNAYTYTVSEVKVKDYETKVEGTTITNTYKNTETTEVSGKKVWEDYNNKFGKRPESITVQLLQNGKEFKTEEVKADKEGNWNFSFKDLPKYDGQGNAYTYTVSEVKVKDYETKVEGTTITNTYKNTETTEVSGKKVWDDNNAIDRPVSIKVDLLQNGKVIETKEVSLTTNWKYTFEKLQVYDANGVAYKYEVKEQPVTGYKSEVNGYDITNTKIKDEPNVDPKDPSKDPKDPSTDPKDPSTDPKDPSTDSKVPPTQENDKTSVWLPKTGASANNSAAMGVLMVLAGMVLTFGRKLRKLLK
ncbi:Cna B-type domain-containing protein [Bacillus nitratireducens]|uniref:Cna B-type domain-containing protein n=2 Tax=Bacillus nitratireducens TaxID=2026193 RepID=UPI001BACD7B6|nr:Cna B-type domain-containing protein [Bacillus nitratireducens]QUG87009.1 Cna B-type domain-containing protein [Bacillus nitratireducens]